MVNPLIQTARPGVLDGLEALRLAVQYNSNKITSIEMALAMPRTFQGDDVQNQAVAFMWLAQFSAKVLIRELGMKGAEDYVERVAESIYEQMEAR